LTWPDLKALQGMSRAAKNGRRKTNKEDEYNKGGRPWLAELADLNSSGIFPLI